jgi:hypothetical protein
LKIFFITKKQRVLGFILLLHFIILLFPKIAAAEEKYKNIDRYARFTPAEFKQSINLLARYLIDGAENDEQIVRAFYVWIAENISYDIQNFLRHQYPDQSPEAVLNRGNAVCDGYANLFKRFCDIANISCVKIVGFSKGYGKKSKIIPEEPNHAWNGVQVNEQWHLIDVTWASGYIHNRKFIKHFSEYYFFTDPAELIFSHFPQNYRHQLLLIPKSKEEFLNQMLLSSEWFEYGLQVVSHNSSMITAKHPLTITIKSPPNVLLSAKLILANKELNDQHTFVQKKDSLNEISILFPKKDIYILRIFAKFQSDSGLYNSVGEYWIDERESSVTSRLFPMPYSDFYEKNCYLINPIKSALEWDKESALEISAPNAEKAAIVKDMHWIYFEKTEKGTFKGFISNPTNNAIIYGLFPGDTKFRALLKFSTKQQP